jgi:DNA-binding transcriptional ArsR family regulator
MSKPRLILTTTKSPPNLTRADVVLHPIRFQILTLVSGRRMSAQKISAALPEVPLASIYRHINKLVEAGVLESIDGTGSRASVERVYSIPTPEAATLSVEDTASVSLEDNLQYFTNFCTLLMSKGRGFIERKAQDGVSGGAYSFEALYLTDSEYEHLMSGLQALEGLALSNRPAPGRRRRLLFTALIPDEEDPAP